MERSRSRQREVRGHQQVERPDRQPDARAAGQQGQQRRLGQAPSRERPARPARRTAISLRRSNAREQEAGEVGARHQQHQPDDEHHQRPRRRSDEDAHRREDQHVGQRHEHEQPGRIPVLQAVPGALRGYRPDGGRLTAQRTALDRHGWLLPGCSMAVDMQANTCRLCGRAVEIRVEYILELSRLSPPPGSYGGAMPSLRRIAVKSKGAPGARCSMCSMSFSSRSTAARPAAVRTHSRGVFSFSAGSGRSTQSA